MSKKERQAYRRGRFEMLLEITSIAVYAGMFIVWAIK